VPAVVFFLPVVGVVFAVAILAFKAEQKRRAELLNFALSKGWMFSPGDPLGLTNRWDGTPFGRGHARQVSNVVRGKERGRDLVSFDYRYTESDTDSNGRRSSRTYRYHVTAVHLPAFLPTIEVSAENVLTRMGGALGMQDIELESEDFNRRYRVRSDNTKFACDVLTPRTMEYLLRGPATAWRTEGTDVLCWDTGRSSPLDILRHVAMLTGIVDGIPAFVWKDHGHDPGLPQTGGGTS